CSALPNKTSAAALVSVFSRGKISGRILATILLCLILFGLSLMWLLCDFNFLAWNERMFCL
ncbi:MAG: hypothetical protein VX228_14865, partial [Pseudomonadota bacterium]|nr:hypothetical protein [Pseudomonadota bacterium]